MKRIGIGVSGVDSLIEGGLLEGKSYLVSGNCGTGKTLFAAHFINESIKQKKTAVYVTFEQDREMLVSDLKRVGINWESKKNLSIIGGNLAYIYKLKEERGAKILDIVEEIKEVAIENNAKRVAIDSVNLFLSLFENPADQRNGLAILIYELTKVGCTVLLTCETKDIDALSWYGFEEFVVDGVMLLKRNLDKDLNSNHRYFQIIKMRGSCFEEGDYPLEISSDGVKIYKNDPSKEFFHDRLNS
jgi:circadian clock protein KaiC